jgi:hypothetical protein
VQRDMFGVLTGVVADERLKVVTANKKTGKWDS